MLEQATYKIRIFYRKQGRLALLSHLEVARALERSIRRAKLPYAISQGFSPHMKIAYGSALPVGVGGLRECFDLSLIRYIPPQDVIEALRNSCVNDLMVFEGDYIGKREETPSVAFPISTYRVELSCPLPFEITIPETVGVVRKKKEKHLHVRDFLLGDIVSNGSIAEFSLIAKPTGSLRPDRFIDAVFKNCEKVEILSLTRINQRRLP